MNNSFWEHMKPTAIVTMMVLILASVGALRRVPRGQAKNASASERKEQSNMTNPKVIMLIEAKIQPQRRAEVIEAARQYLPLVRAEPGVEAFYLTARQDDPNTLVSTRFTSLKRHRISISSRTSRRNSWRR